MAIRNLVSVLLAAAPLGACYGGGDRREVVEDPAEVPLSIIDPGAGIADVVPGQGAGVFVEYEGEGEFHVFATCDTEFSGFECRWRIFVAAQEQTELDLSADRLESDDDLLRSGELGARLLSWTAFDVDGFFVTVDPPVTLRFDVTLDGLPANSFLFWVSDGGLNAGAPANPVDLVPGDL